MQIELYSKIQNPIEAITQLGEMFARSGMFGCERKEQGEVLAMACLTEQKSPTEIINHFHIIDGKLSRKAVSASAKFREIGGKIKWIKTGMETDQTEEGRCAIAEFTRDGESLTVEWNMAMAQRAGLIKSKSQWEKAPWKMLRARVLSEGLTMLAPEIYCGDIDEPDDAPQTAKEIKLEMVPEPQHEASPEKPKEKETEVVEAEVVEPSPEPSEEKSSQDKPESAAEHQDEGLPPDIVDKLEKAIGADAKICIAFIQQLGWLQKGQDLSHLRIDHANQILNKVDNFKKVAKEKAA